MLKPHEIPWTFKSWIANFEGVDLPIGDLAGDVKRSGDFPEEDDFCELLDYMRRKTNSDIVMETFCEAWNYYQISTK